MRSRLNRSGWRCTQNTGTGNGRRAGWLTFLLCLVFVTGSGCQTEPAPEPAFNPDPFAQQVFASTRDTWETYRRFAFGKDELLPVSRWHQNWYASSMYLSMLDAYSTLSIMGMKEQVAEIERFIVRDASFDKDLSVKTFEVNIRVLGGLLSAYVLSENELFLSLAVDLGDRLLPAFNSPTGIPYLNVNLRTGATDGEIVNSADGGTYLIEFGVLSYYTDDPKYYQAAKKASVALFDRRSERGLVGQNINVRTGEWIQTDAHIGAMIDSYYEYLYKAWLLFGDEDARAMWDEHISAIHSALAFENNDLLWYGKAEMDTGQVTNKTVTLYDAYFSGLLALSGDLDRAGRTQDSWDYYWKRRGLPPLIFDVASDSILDASYYLNPEIIESAYYLHHYTGDDKYARRAAAYYRALVERCQIGPAFTVIENVETGKQGDIMPSYFLSETLKYLFLTFTRNSGISPKTHVFNTEGHVFRIDKFDRERVRRTLGL